MDRQAFDAAIRQYWIVREGQAQKQQDSGRVDAGLRGAVAGGAHMDPMAELMESIFVDAGFPPSSISRGSAVELPGYFRPEKKWDLVVVHGDALAAAIEFKSQVGPSFGNNYNNRSEEAIGNAVDIWTAYREGALWHCAPLTGISFSAGGGSRLHQAGARQTTVLRGRPRVPRRILQETLRAPVPPTDPRAALRRRLLRHGLCGSNLTGTRASTRPELCDVRCSDQGSCCSAPRNAITRCR